MCPSQNVICELDMNTVILKLFHWLIEQHAPQLMRVEVVVVYIVYWFEVTFDSINILSFEIVKWVFM